MLRRRGRSPRLGASEAASADAGVDAPHIGASPTEVGVEVISTLERLDEKLQEIAAAAEVSDDAARAVFASFRMDIPLSEHDDPGSDAYRQAQFDLYSRISSRAGYSTSNEVSGFAVDPRIPFPYYTHSATTVGDQLIALGYLIRTMNLP